MERVKFLYNPISGNRSLKNNLDLVINKFQKKGYQIVPHRLNTKEETISIMDDIKAHDYSSVIVCGGDGTVNNIINGMIKNNIDLPLGIIPCGTSNDFADYLGVSGNINKICDIILSSTPKYVDMGKINDNYFINVVGGGVLTSVAHKIDLKVKSSLGMMGYYLRGIGELPNIKPFSGEITWDNGVLKDDFLVFLVLNSSSAGGFKKIAPNAKINDGLLDVIVIKNCIIPELLGIFVKLLRGEHLTEKKIEYFQTANLSIKTQSKNVDIDIDGELGPGFPLEIQTISNKLRIFMP